MALRLLVNFLSENAVPLSIINSTAIGFYYGVKSDDPFDRLYFPLFGTTLCAMIICYSIPASFIAPWAGVAAWNLALYNRQKYLENRT